MKDVCICIENKLANLDRNTVLVAGVTKYLIEMKFWGLLAEKF